MPELASVIDTNTHLAYARLSPDWQKVANNENPITIPGGNGSNGFRPTIDTQLEPFTNDKTYLIIGQTIAHIRFGQDLGFNGPAFLRPEIIGVNKATDEVLILRQTNSLCMGHTDWPIRVEVVTPDRKPISAEELAKYDFYMFLQYYDPPTVAPVSN